MRMLWNPPGAEGDLTRRRGTGLLASVMLLLAIVVVLSSACDTRASVPTPHATATVTPTGLPAFADWRVLYADHDRRLHAVSLDGKQDVTGGAMLADLGRGPLTTPSASPDGHWLAYWGDPNEYLLDLTGRHATLRFPAFAPSIVWTADSSLVIVDDGQNAGIIQLPDGVSRPIPPVQGATFGPLGWVDRTHVAGTYAPILPPPTRVPTSTPISSGSPPPGPQTKTLAVEDITTGAVHTVFSLTSSSFGLGYFRLAPDGQHALFYNTRWRDDPYTPDFRLIDMATGAATKLPHLSQVLGQGYGVTSIAWRAGTLTLAASTGNLVNGDLKTWIVDAQHDTAQALPDQDAAYVGGWVPDSDTLVLTDTYFSYGYAGPFTLTAVANATSGPGATTILTDSAYHLSFGGFARTAG